MIKAHENGVTERAHFDGEIKAFEIGQPCNAPFLCPFPEYHGQAGEVIRDCRYQRAEFYKPPSIGRLGAHETGQPRLLQAGLAERILHQRVTGDEIAAAV